ncbi:MAG: M23 family metallopeptidase [Proteobacteria bacterium]|nr:M23 family metallopeptidase [Pseudomonadota bacterium]
MIAKVIAAAMERRLFLVGAAAFSALPRIAWADSARTMLSGAMEQGSLVVGRTEPGAKVELDGNSVSVSPEGLFAFGFAYDQTKPCRLAIRYKDLKIETRDVTPTKRQYEIQRITGLPEKFVSPPADVEARIQRENALVGEARKRDTGGTAFSEPFDWPAVGIVSGVFGSQRILNGEPKAPHFGVDIAAGEGAPIHAPADGVVSLADPDFYLTGGTTVLDHGHGVSTTYIHQSELKVTEGEKVVRGQLIGLVGHKAAPPVRICIGP